MTLATMSLALAFGCAKNGDLLCVDRCADIPSGAIPEPPGTKVCRWQTEQVESAIADQTVLYLADFVAASAELSPGALERMSRHAQSGLASTLPWIVQPSTDSDLDAARVARVMNELSLRGVNAVDVQVATPAALGLEGPFAEQAAGRLGTSRGNRAGTGAPISQAGGFGTGVSGAFGTGLGSGGFGN